MSLIGILGILVAILLIGGIVYWLLRRTPGAGLNDDERTLLKAGTFDRYKLRRVRKRAVLSTMYQAVDRETKAPVAIRILRADLSSDPDHVKSFKRRGEIIEFLNKEHPDLPFVRLLKYGQYKVGQTLRPFIAVEYFEGQDLGELLQQKKALPVAEAVAIVTQVAKALSAALREKVWHHQMALQAVMVRYPKEGAPEAKLVDFDLARPEQGGGAAGATDGKLMFMSPEQFENKIVDDRSDIFSLGALFYVLLAGAPPFPGSDYAEVARLQKTGAPAPLPAGIPEPVRAIVMKMLQKQPLDRYRSMEDVLAACQGLKIQSAWHAAPDTSAARPMPVAGPKAAPAPAAAPARVETRKPPARESAPRKRGGVGSMLVEIPMLIIAPIGRLFSKLTPLKIVIGVLILVVAVVAYLLLRSNTVSGDLKLQVASGKGGVLGGAAVVIEPVQVAGAEQPTVTFTDVVTDVATKGKLEGKTSSAGLIQLKYAVTPGTRFTVRISAPEFIDHTDSIAIRSDSSIVLAYTLSPKPVAVPTAFALTVMVHDRAKNPIPAVNIRITGKSGKEYALTGDVRGMASLEYDPAVDGPTPEVSIAAPSLGPDYAQSTPKPQKVAGHQLLIDINTYFPYDQTLDKYVSQAEASIRNKDWDEARPPLLKAVQLRPGRGSGKAFTLLAQAWWEDNTDNFKEALQAARSALLDEANVTGSDRDVIVEKMHFYETRAQYESWRDTKSAANKQATLAASERYLALVKGPRYASLVKTNNVIKDHLEEVQDINEAMK